MTSQFRCCQENTMLQLGAWAWWSGWNQSLELSSRRYRQYTTPWTIQGLCISLYKLYLRYSTSCGERESWPFQEEPETFISILNKHYSYARAPGAFCCVLSTADTSTTTGQESSTGWPCISKTERKTEIRFTLGVRPRPSWGAYRAPHTL